MKTIILASLLLFQWQWQTTDLVGKWNFHKYESSQQLDAETKAMLNNAFSSFYYEFRNDATYDLQKKRKKENGAWKAEGQLLTTTNADGFTDEIKFIQKHKDTLRLELEKGEFIVFSREK